MASRIKDTTKEGRAVAKYIQSSPMKIRRSADLVRGKDLMEARRLLAFSPLRGSKLLSKVLESAAANAINNFQLPEDRLFIYRVFVDDGPTYKRWRPKAYGRAGKIRKRRSHITVVVRAHERGES